MVICARKQEIEASKPKIEPVSKPEVAVVHESNEWGISLLSETVEEEETANDGGEEVLGLVAGVKTAYAKPKADPQVRNFPNA